MKQIFEIDCDGGQVAADFIREYLQEQFKFLPFAGRKRDFIIKVKEITDRPVQGVPFDEYGYDKMKAKSAVAIELSRQGLVEVYNDGNIFWCHPTAIIDKADIGKNSKIWHFSHVSDAAVIGANCVLGQNVFIGEGVKIGSGCKIQNNVFIPKGVEIESDVFIGPGTTFTNIKNPRAFISRKDEFKSTVVRIGASIGANATILCNNTIGRYAMIGAGAVVTKNIDDFRVAFGNPAKVVGTISIDGSKISYF